MRSLFVILVATIIGIALCTHAYVQWAIGPQIPAQYSVPQPPVVTR